MEMTGAKVKFAWSIQGSAGVQHDEESDRMAGHV